MKRRRRREAALWLSVVLAIVLGTTTTAYAAHFSSHALPGVSIAGQSITGQSREQAAQILADRVDAVRVAVTIDRATTELSLADLGVTVDTETTLTRAFADNSQFAPRVGALFTKRDVAPAFTIDENVAQATIKKLLSGVGVPARDAEVHRAEGGGFSVDPSQTGKSVDASAVIDEAGLAAASLTSRQLTLTSTQLAPTVTTQMAQDFAAAATKLATLEVSVAGRVDAHSPWPVDRYQWIALPKPGQPLGAPELDAALVTQWVQSVADATKVEPSDGVRNVTPNGDVVSTPTEGVTGYTVNNVAAITDALIASLTAGQPYAGQFEYDTVEPKYETRVVAAGSERLVYQAAPDEKWIDLNLGNNTVTAYQGATVIQGPTYIVPGMPGMETPTGTFHVYLKYQTQTMRGTNLDGTKYVAENIPWVTYFTGSIAFHGAPWRDSFGWNGPGGSHGCVNMPSDAAQFIYNWAPMGTVVVSHY